MRIRSARVPRDAFTTRTRSSRRFHDAHAFPAMLVVALLNAAAELDEILVDIHDHPFDRLRRARVVSAVVERYPAPLVLVPLTNLRPGHPVTWIEDGHAINLSRPMSHAQRLRR